MASSMLTGDRRWAPTRKSGMTVLGKVPKPINLPSQRLENHGLDPNVEIVPKGTLTWGSRPSSATPNAWGSSNQSSPNTDGSVNSQSRLYGRPSSGGTRPSTAGSDRSLEPISNAWTSNSRPSSASGVLVSNQSSLVARPRSAETRPGSSQLSRFADENSVSQSSGIADRLEHVSSKDTNFTLSSGDFPTLGSEKNSELHGQQANNFPHGHPSSASVIETEQKETPQVSSIGDEPVNSISSDKESANSWKPDTQPYAGVGPPSIGNWQREPHMAQTYPNMNLQDFNAWHGPRVHNLPDGAWYRGVSHGGPYRPTGPPGSYPMKHFAYYPAQIPAGSASDSQSAPRAGAVLGGYPPKNGESFRPRCSTDTYAASTAPVISGWPGVYPGPVPYEGYCGPYRPNVDKLSSGMTTGHGSYNQYQHQEPGKFHGCTSGYVGSGVNQQHLEASHTHETHGGQYRVLLKQHDAHFISNDSNEKREQPLVGNTPYLGSVSHQKDIMREGGNVEARNSEKAIETVESSSMGPASDCGSSSQTGSAGKLHEISSKAREIDDSPGGTSNHGITSTDSQHYPVKKSTKLIEKIEGLNNKVRISDGHSEGPFAARGDYTRESRNEKIKVDKSTGLHKSHVVSLKNVSNSTGKSSTVVAPDSDVLETSMKGDNEEYSNVKIIPQSSEVHPVVGSDPLDAGPRIHSHVPRSAHDMHSWAESHAKTRANISGRDEWRKQSSKNDSSFANAINKKVNLSEACDQSVFQELPSQKGSHSENNDGDKSHALSSLDPKEYHAQRTKMKEIAMQRAKQLQKEEEERTREQKAKAFAKLEELNKRTSTESSNKNRNLVPQQNNVLHVPQISVDPMDKTTNCIKAADANFQPGIGESLTSEGTDLLQEIEPGAIRIEQSVLARTSDSGATGPGISNLVEKNNTDKNSNPGGGLEFVPNPDSGNNNLRHSTVSSPKIDDSDSIKDSQVISYNSSMPNDPNAPIFSTKGKIQESGITKQRQMGHRKKQNIQPEKSFGEMPISPVDTDRCKGGYVSIDDALTNNSNEIGENLTQNKKKNNRGFRPKHKPVESLHISKSSSMSCSEGIPEKHLEGEMTKSSGLISEAVPIIDHVSEETMKGHHSSDSVISSSQGWLQSADESRRQAVSQWRSHPPRRTARNTQPRLVDKAHGVEAVWAPVKPSSKGEPTGTSNNSEPTEVIASKGLEKVSDHSPTKNTNNAENNFKSKRAEMERYVPKVIAKELSRRESIHQPTDVNQVVPVEITNFDHGGSLVEVTVEHKNWDHGKPMKHGKSRTSWRKRNSHEGASSTNAVATIHHHVNEQSANLDSSFQQIIHSNDGWSVDNANVLPSDSDIIPLGDKESANRVKRQGHKVDKIVVSNDTISDTKNLSRGSTKKLDTQPPAFGWSDLDSKSSLRNESRIAVEHTRSQWKPKAHVHSSHTQEKGNRSIEVPVQSVITDKASPLQIMGDHQMLNAESQSNISPDILVPEARNVNKHESSKSNIESLKNQAVSPNQDSSHVAEQAPAIAEPHRGQGNGMRRYGRFNKGQETHHVGVRGSGLDSGKNNLPAKIDRPRHNSHYGYQKIESHNRTTDSNQSNVVVSEDPKDTFHATGPAYRGKGQSYSRRGAQLYVRNMGPSRNCDKHDITE